MNNKPTDAYPTEKQIDEWFSDNELPLDDFNGWTTSRLIEAARLAYKAGATAEREACAKVCEDLNIYDEDDPGESFAAAIRARPTSD